MFRSSFAVVVGAMVAIVAGVSSSPAYAIKQFDEAFKELYVKEGSPLAAEVEKAKCNVCHVGKNKKDRNAYGTALVELLDKKEDKDNKEKIRKALETVAAMPSDPKDAGSPTFGDLIKDGKLPGGPVE
ncbi:MAG: hypothetical protein ACKOEX_02100 [Planctomycetia bacterium]